VHVPHLQIGDVYMVCSTLQTLIAFRKTYINAIFLLKCILCVLHGTN